MKVVTVYIATEGGSFDGFTHLILNRSPYLGLSRVDISIEKTCGQVHDERIDYLDCPVASRWTLMRTPTPTE